MKKTLGTLVLVLGVSAIVARGGPTGTSEDEAGIKQTALDFAEGWYEGKPDRVEKAVHPDLAQRSVTSDKTGKNRLEQTSGLGLILGVRAGHGKRVPKDEQQKDVTILDRYGNVASVKLVMQGWVEYLHLAKWNGEWKIVNVLTEVKPGPK
jgi:hypothetical protein